MADRIYSFLVVLGISIVGLLLLELICRQLLATPDQSTAAAQSRPDRRAELAAYAGAEYDAAAYWSEFHRAKRERYEPYVVWRQDGFDGELIRIDDEGNRHTPASRSGADSLRIWLFGGSVAWGMGVPDQHTIANYLALELSRHGVPADVQNLGEIGFVSSQEMIQLLRELQQGRQPDLAIFIDGANDAPAAALWPEPPGTHMNFFEIRDRFETPQSQTSPLWELITASGTFRLAKWLADRLPGADNNSVPWDAPADAREIRRRGAQAAAIWLRNQAMIRSLGQEFGFSSLFVLQPALMLGPKPLHDSEREILSRETQNEAKSVSMAVYAEMVRDLRESRDSVDTTAWLDAVDAFADHEEALYIDYVHLADAGNRILAELIIEATAVDTCAGPALPDRLAAHCPRLRHR